MRRTYYHISDKYLGINPTLQPRIPESIGPTECKKTKRVCFAPSIQQAMNSKVGVPKGTLVDVLVYYVAQTEVKNPVVYKTRQALMKPDSKISDYRKTEEVWSLDEITVTLVGYLDLKKLFKTGEWKITNRKNSKFSQDWLDGWKACRWAKHRLIIE